MDATASTRKPSMWNSVSQYKALATRKFLTSFRPKLKISVPQSGCSPKRGSACSYKAVPSNLASAHSSLGKCAGTQSKMTPIPALCSASIKNLNSSGEPKRDVGAKKEVTW